MLVEKRIRQLSGPNHQHTIGQPADLCHDLLRSIYNPEFLPRSFGAAEYNFRFLLSHQFTASQKFYTPSLTSQGNSSHVVVATIRYIAFRDENIRL
jgi:hypothetical protein